MKLQPSLSATRQTSRKTRAKGGGLYSLSDGNPSASPFHGSGSFCPRAGPFDAFANTHVRYIELGKNRIKSHQMCCTYFWTGEARGFPSCLAKQLNLGTYDSVDF